MDKDLARMIERKAVLTKGKQLKHEIPEVIKRSDLSEASIDVMETFGINTAALLNTYACTVEDALVEQAHRTKEYRDICILLKDEVARLRELVPEEDRYPEQLQSEED